MAQTAFIQSKAPKAMATAKVKNTSLATCGKVDPNQL